MCSKDTLALKDDASFLFILKPIFSFKKLIAFSDSLEDKNVSN
jgi:hypothetical protein